MSWAQISSVSAEDLPCALFRRSSAWEWRSFSSPVACLPSWRLAPRRWLQKAPASQFFGGACDSSTVQRVLPRPLITSDLSTGVSLLMGGGLALSSSAQLPATSSSSWNTQRAFRLSRRQQSGNPSQKSHDWCTVARKCRFCIFRFMCTWQCWEGHGGRENRLPSKAFALQLLRDKRQLGTRFGRALGTRCIQLPASSQKLSRNCLRR